MPNKKTSNINTFPTSKSIHVGQLQDKLLCKTFFFSFGIPNIKKLKYKSMWNAEKNENHANAVLMVHLVNGLSLALYVVAFTYKKILTRRESIKNIQ